MNRLVRRCLASLGRGEVVWMTLSIAVLLTYLHYARVSFDPGFALDEQWRVVTDYGVPAEADGPELGERLLRIGDLRYESWRASRFVDFGGAFDEPVLELEVLREGRPLVIQYPLARAGARPNDLLYWVLPLYFWIAGTLTVVLARPRDVRRRLLALVWFATALWLAAGPWTFYRVANAQLIYLVSIWSMPALVLHLHLVLPRVLGGLRAHRWTVGAIWTLTATLAILDLPRHFLPRGAIFPVLGIAILVSIGLSLRRVWRSRGRGHRAAPRLMLLGIAFGLAPLLLYSASSAVSAELARELLSSRAFFFSFVLLLPLWPLCYFYVIFRHRIGTVGLRANRAVGAYGFAALAASAMLLLVTAFGEVVEGNPNLLPPSVAAAAFFALFAAPLYRRFQGQLDRHVFGIRHSPEEALAAFSQEIPVAEDRSAVARLVADDIVPTLMVRQSALVVYAGDPPATEILHATGLDAHQLAALSCPPPELEGRHRVDRSVPAAARSWVRFAAPLTSHDTTLGIWLLGSRDPDDFYPESDVVLIRSLASQIASALRNLELIEAIRHSTEELEQRNRELERFSFTVSHDLKAPLVTIKGFLGLVERAGAASDAGALAHGLRRIDSAVESMRRLLEGLLEMARMGRDVNMVAGVVLTEIVELAIASLEDRTAERDARISIVPDLPVVHADPTRLYEVFLNLLDNALKFNGGAAPRIEIACRRAADGTPILVVRDDGPGIAPRDRAQVFEIFNRLDPATEGTGIGLALVKTIVEAHGGRVWVEDSGWETGSAFCFTLAPAEPDASMEPSG